MSSGQRGLTGWGVFCIWLMFGVTYVLMGYFSDKLHARLDTLDAACGVEQVEGG